MFGCRCAFSDYMLDSLGIWYTLLIWLPVDVYLHLDISKLHRFCFTCYSNRIMIRPSQLFFFGTIHLQFFFSLDNVAEISNVYWKFTYKLVLSKWEIVRIFFFFAFSPECNEIERNRIVWSRIHIWYEFSHCTLCWTRELMYSSHCNIVIRWNILTFHNIYLWAWQRR